MLGPPHIPQSLRAQPCRRDIAGATLGPIEIALQLGVVRRIARDRQKRLPMTVTAFVLQISMKKAVMERCRLHLGEKPMRLSGGHGIHRRQETLVFKVLKQGIAIKLPT